MPGVKHLPKPKPQNTPRYSSTPNLENITLCGGVNGRPCFVFNWNEMKRSPPAQQLETSQPRNLNSNSRNHWLQVGSACCYVCSGKYFKTFQNNVSKQWQT